ncbi:LOW QUALITY PROTEIN: intraflagellar transport protein 88 homolog [Lethenteron reissneri]|uniref:LOW QUALITY PROTEIN: intraflagellar transport protein 88 homolog n=1 Tax=Lethenteron reissneri TaxID=7753 RepID=UPI002AB7A3A1|nr:LOW QUALITY PROTEIN: intraflagellar transport protein 88 homolog [Lethenteron reissneri]
MAGMRGEHIMLVPEEEEEDLYSGYNEYNPTYDIEELENDPGFQQAVKTSHGRRPPMTAKIPGTAAVRAPGTAMMMRNRLVSSIGGRPITGAVQDGSPGARPLTAVRAAGYSSMGSRGAAFDPMGQSRGPAPPLETKGEDTPEEKLKQMEKKVMLLVEESVMAGSRGDLTLALEKAKDAGRKERTLVREREQAAASDNTNLDLTYAVMFNLGNQYAANEMYSEALSTYQVIIKNKMFSSAGRLKVNMANVYLKQKNFPKAIKFYRMALDQVPSSQREMRMKIMQNIGVAFLRVGHYTEAVSAFEHIMSESPDLRAAFNLTLCYFALGEHERIKRAFQRLVAVPLGVGDEDRYTPHNEDPHTNLVIDAIKNDMLRQMERERRTMAERFIMTAAKLIAPAIEETFVAGYDWCVETVKASQYVELANDLEINKAIMYLKLKDFDQAVEALKMFEKKDTRVKSAAATNLAFLFFLRNDVAQAERYADAAMAADRYNPQALVNKGNCLFLGGSAEQAADYYREALRNDASCTEALYNLGLAHKHLGRLQDALDCFLKLHSILRNHPPVMHHIASIYEALEEAGQAAEWLLQLVTVVPTDPHALARLGDVYDADGDKSQALQYHYESYRHYPCDIEVIEWLGAYYIDSQFCEKAIQYFERAALIQPTQVKWRLMVASCYRRSGNYQKALETYKMVHVQFPENVECLKFLVRLCNDMGLKEAQEYATKLKRAEKARDVKEQRVKSGRVGSGRTLREGSAGSDRGGSGQGVRAERLSGKLRSVAPGGQGYDSSNPGKPIDASYSDPLGPQAERPRTAAARRRPQEDDDFGDDEITDELLPD